MSDPARHTATRIRELLEQAGAKPRHDLGQNFLIDLNLLDVAVQGADLSPGDVVLEVGTGTGSLTAQLAPRVRHVVAVEFDPLMARLTAEAVSGCGNVTLLNQDVLRNKNHLADEVLAAVKKALSPLPRGGGEGQGEGVSASRAIETPHPNLLPFEGRGDQSETIANSSVLKLVANLPYNVATPVISNLIATELPWSRMVVTIQLELAERMTAPPCTGEYSALSVWLQSQCRLEILRRLPPTVFWPRPKVDSAIVRIDRDPALQSRIADRTAFHEFLREIFTQRRKHLLGVVARLASNQRDRAALEAIHREFGIANDVRAEALSVEQLVTYHNRLLIPQEPAAFPS